LALGGRTIAELKEVMSSDEFTDWMAYYQISPFGDYRQDIQAALVASTIANANAPKGKVYKITDFMVNFKDASESRHMSGPEIMSFLQNLQRKGSS
jgi:hypothetical protein